MPQPPFTSLDPTPLKTSSLSKMASKDDFEKGVAAPTLNKIRIVSSALVAGRGKRLALFARPVSAAGFGGDNETRSSRLLSSSFPPDADLAQRQEP